MKKKYIIPTLHTVNVNPTQMLAYSLPIDPNEQVDVNFTKNSGDWDIWGSGSDDDFDEEY